MAGQVGAALAGYPIGKIIENSSDNNQMWNQCIEIIYNIYFFSFHFFFYDYIYIYYMYAYVHCM